MGKGYGSTTIPVQAGIIVDLNRLYRKFRQKGSTRLTDFCEVFCEMGMNEIWKGRQSSAELIEFSEKLLQLCSTYMCSVRQKEASGSGDLIPLSEEERIFGIYCTYGFYYLQPSDYITQIRVTQDDFLDIGEFFEQKLVPKRLLDAACCLYKLIDSGAFRIVPFKNSFDPSFHRRYDVPDCEEIVTELSDEPFSIISEVVNDPILKHVGIIQEKYDKMKTTHLPTTRPGKNLYEALTELVAKEKTSFIDERIRSSNLLTEDLDSAKAAVIQMQNGQNPCHQKSSKNALKHRAYGASITYNRNRRYADPSLPVNPEDDINEKNIFKNITSKPQNNNEEVIEAEEESNQDINLFDPKEESLKKRGRPVKRRGATTSSNIRKKSRKEDDNVADETLTLARKEGRAKAAQKKASQKKVADAIAAGELLPLDEPEIPGTPSNPVEIITDPLAQKALRTPRTILETDPDVADIAKTYKTTNNEIKAMQAVEELIGATTPSTSRTTTARARAPRGSKKPSKKTDIS